MGQIEDILKKGKDDRQQTEQNLELFLPLLKQNTFQNQAAEVKKVSWWKKMISVLSTGETGHAAFQFLEGKNPIIEYGKDVIRSARGQGFERKTWADVLEKVGFSTKKLSDLFPELYTETGKGIFKLKEEGFIDFSANGTLGLALDIALDPKTYLGGLGIFQRMGIKGKGLTKAGRSIYNGTQTRVVNVVNDLGTTDESLKIVGNITEKMSKKLSSNPDKYFSGITLLGGNLVPRKVALAPGRFFDFTMQRIPVLGQVYTGAKAGIQDMFKYGADTIRAGKTLGEAGEETAKSFVKTQQMMYKRSRQLTNQNFKSVTNAWKQFKKGIPKDQHEAVIKFIRDGMEGDLTQFGFEKIDEDLVKNLMGILEEHNTKFFRTEAQAIGSLNKEMYSEVSGYLSHIMSDEAKKMLTDKKVAKFLPRGFREFSTKPEQSRTWFRFRNKKTGEVIHGSKEFLGLNEFSRLTEEKFLTRKANRLIKTRSQGITKIQRQINQLTKKQLREALKDPQIKIPTKIARLREIPKGFKSLRKAGESPTGLQMFQESFVKKPKFKILTAETSNRETAQFIDNLINMPNKNVEKLARLLDTKEKGLGKLVREIAGVKDNLADDIAGMGTKSRWFKNSAGDIFEAERHASITDINTAMQEGMDVAGKKLGYGRGKPFFLDNPFEITYKRGENASRNIAAFEYYNDVVGKYGRRGELVETFTRNPNTRKTTMTQSVKEFVDSKTGFRYVDPGIKEFPTGTLLPDFIVKDMKKVKQFIDNDEVKNQILKTYDNIIREWKGSVYGWYPASHGRNLIGGIHNNWLAGLHPLSSKYRLTRRIMKGDNSFIKTSGGLKISYKQIREELTRRGVLGQTGMLDINELRNVFNPSIAKKVHDLPMKGMEAVENSLRVPLFVDTLQKTNSFDEAAKTVFKYHFDYAPEALSTFEKSVMKRLIPFYRWTRGNIPLMMEEFIAQPGKMTGLFKVLREMQDEEGNLMQDLLPSFIEKQFAITRGGQTITGTGLPPIEMLKMLQEPVRTFESGLTPFLKIPIELRAKFSLFKDMSIMKDTSGNFAKNYPEPLRNWLQLEEKTVTKKDGTTFDILTVDPMRKYWLYALPTARMASLAGTLMGEKEKNKLLNTITGLRTFEFDMQQLRDSQERTYERELIEIFTNAGLFGQIQYPFADVKEAAGIPSAKQKSKNPLLN